MRCHSIKYIPCAILGKPPGAAFWDTRLTAELIKECQALGIGFVPKELLGQFFAVGSIASIAENRFWTELVQFQHNFVLRFAMATYPVAEADNFRPVLLYCRSEVGVSIDFDEIDDDAF
jgi:glutathionyl-hydroquinone reductase